MTVAEMKIRAIAPWFGGKRTLAPEIVKQFGTHKAYWELFSGSLAVLFAKDSCSHETICDLHGEAVNLARVIAGEEAPDLYQRLLRTTFSEPLFHEVRGRLRNGEYEGDLDRAYCFFVESWMGRNGVAGTRASNTAFCVRFTSNGGDPSVRFAAAVDSIPAWHQRLRGVWILERDAFDVAERIEDKDGTVIYADPPYLVKGAKYVHDFADEDHDRLAKILRRFKKTRVLVSYYDDPRLSSLYKGWSKLSLKATKAMVNQGKRDSGGAVEAPEVLLINGPALSGSSGLF